MSLFAGLHVVVLLVWLALVALWVASLVDALRRPDAQWQAAGQNKTLFVLLIILTGWLGALLYAVIPRPALKQAAIG